MMRTLRFTVVTVLALGLMLGCGSKKSKEESLETKEFKKVAEHMNSNLQKLADIEKNVQDAKGGLDNPLKALGAAKKLIGAFGGVAAIVAALALPGDQFQSVVVKTTLASVNKALTSWDGGDCDGITCALAQVEKWASLVDALIVLTDAAGKYGVKMPKLRP